MKNPNGYGTCYRLSGNRRKPWIARITAGWKYKDRLTGMTIDQIPDDQNPLETLPDGKLRFKERRVYDVIGYYPTQQDAMIALANYNADPYDLHINTMTLEELYDNY